MHVVQHLRVLPRFVSVLLVSGLVTISLLLMMERLIYSDVPILNEEPYPKIPPIVMEPRKPHVPVTPRPDPVEEREPEPPRPVEEWTPPEHGSPPIARWEPDFSDGPVLSGAANLPFLRVMAPPVYPARAARRGIEGFVDVSFDVTASGATENIQVIYAEPEGMFEQAAHAAVERWRFEPRMVDGQPERFVGLSKRVRFTLQK